MSEDDPGTKPATTDEELRKRKEKKDRVINDLPIRCVSFLHAVIISQGCARRLLISEYDEALKTDFYGFDAESQFYFGIAAGYFLWDMLVSIWFQWGIGFVAHGISCFFVYGFSQYPFLHYWGLYFLLYELSTPFLHARWFLIAIKQKGAILTLIQLCFVGAFVSMRLVLGSIASYTWWGLMLKLLESGQAHSNVVVIMYLCCNVVLNALNWYWFSQILAGATGKGKKADREEPIDQTTPGAAANAAETAATNKNKKKTP